MKRLTILFLITGISIAAIVAAASSPLKTFLAPASKSQQMPQNIPDAPGTIDGAKTPEKIPDRVAYSLVLRLISGYKDETERHHIKAYINQMGIQSDADVNAIFAVAEEYKQQVAAIDTSANGAKVQELRNQSGLSSTTQSRLMELRSQRDLLIDKSVVSLSNRLSPDGLAKMSKFINERVKKKVKMRPS